MSSTALLSRSLVIFPGVLHSVRRSSNANCRVRGVSKAQRAALYSRADLNVIDKSSDSVPVCIAAKEESVTVQSERFDECVDYMRKFEFSIESCLCLVDKPGAEHVVN